MKKILFLILIMFFIFSTNIRAISVTISKDEIENCSYVIGTYLFTRNLNENYDGRLTTPKIMVASHSIPSLNESDMIIYYKASSGEWHNALTWDEVTVPASFEITKIDLLDPEVPVQASIFLDGVTFAQKIRTLSGNSNAINETIVAFTNVTEDPNMTFGEENILSVDNSSNPIYGWFNNGTIYYYSESTEFYLNPDSSYMFSNLKSLVNINFELISFDKVVNAEGMFKDSTSLESISISGLPKVTNASYMFAGCSSLENVYLTHLDSLINMSYMFDGCVKLNDVSFDLIDTSSVSDMTVMFRNCRSLKTLDLSLFDMASANTTNMFYGAESLSTLITPKVSPRLATTLPRELYDEDLNGYQYLNQATPKEKRLEAIATFLPGQDFNAKIKRIAGNSDATYDTTDINIEGIVEETVIPENMTFTSDNLVSSNLSSNPIYAWYEDGILYYYSLGITLFANEDSSYMFYKMSNLESIDLNSIDTRNTLNMSMMFGNLESLESINFNNFDTSNVINMSGMFAGCSNLTSLSVSNFDTSNVTNMGNMFYNCSKLNQINLMNFDTSKVTNMDYMFAGLARVATLDLSSFDIGAGTSTNGMLSGMSLLNEIITPNSNASEIKLLAVMRDENANVYSALTNETPASTSIIRLTTLASGRIFNAKLKALAGNPDATYETIDNNVQAIIRVDVVPSEITFDDLNLISEVNSEIPVYAWYDTGIIYYYSEATKIYLNGDSDNMTTNFNSLEEFDMSEFGVANS